MLCYIEKLNRKNMRNGKVAEKKKQEYQETVVLWKPERHIFKNKVVFNSVKC